MESDVVICECFARDGLQHESMFVPTEKKLELLVAFTAAGFPRIEATSYSHPGVVPAFSDATEVLKGLSGVNGPRFKATCPNERAVRRANADLDAGAGADELSLLVSATDSHSERNLRKTREQQWDMVERMAQVANDQFELVGVISVALGCPFEGPVDIGRVVDDFGHFADLGVGLVTVGDTTGLATPRSVSSLFARLSREHPDTAAVAHFHNTRGTALANCVAALDAGCRHFDSALGGVGGHPSQIEYGHGMTGNAATEDLVSLFESMGVSTGLDMGRLAEASARCESVLGRQLHSMVARAGFDGAIGTVANA